MNGKRPTRTLHPNNDRVLQDFIAHRICNRRNPFPLDAEEALREYIDTVHYAKVTDKRLSGLAERLHSKLFEAFVDSLGNSQDIGYGWTNSFSYHAPCECECRNNRIGLETKGFLPYPDLETDNEN